MLIRRAVTHSTPSDPHRAVPVHVPVPLTTEQCSYSKYSNWRKVKLIKLNHLVLYLLVLTVVVVVVGSMCSISSTPIPSNQIHV